MSAWQPPGQRAARLHGRAAGLDFPREVVAIARRNLAGAEIRSGDAHAPPFGDDSFDAAVCGYGIIHVPEPELRKPLRSKGKPAFGAIRAGSRSAKSVPSSPSEFPDLDFRRPRQPLRRSRERRSRVGEPGTVFGGSRARIRLVRRVVGNKLDGGQPPLGAAVRRGLPGVCPTSPRPPA